MTSRKTLILSLDALSNVDAPIFRELEGFRYLMDNGATIQRVKSIYPSLTYPCHATLSTGRYPNEHGVVNNLKLQPEKEKMDWYWFEKDIVGDTIFRAARRAGLKTSALLWPVSASAHIDYNLAEIIPHRFYHNQMLVSLLHSTPWLAVYLDRKFGHLRKGIQQPELDEFIEACMNEILVKFHPDLMAVHYIDIDEQKHRYGTKAVEVEASIRRADQRIRNALKMIEKTSSLRHTNLIVLSDHSQIDLKKGLRVNRYLKEKGYITVNKEGVVTDFRAIMHEAGGAAFVYLKDPSEKNRRAVKMELDQFRLTYGGIEKILEPSEFIAKGADKKAQFMLEGERGCYFLQGIDGEMVDTSYPKHVATHGYDPEKEDFQAVFFAVGPDFKHIQIEEGELIHMAPTIARIMNLDLQGATGRVMEEILVRKE